MMAENEKKYGPAQLTESQIENVINGWHNKRLPMKQFASTAFMERVNKLLDAAQSYDSSKPKPALFVEYPMRHWDDIFKRLADPKYTHPDPKVQSALEYLDEKMPRSRAVYQELLSHENARADINGNTIIYGSTAWSRDNDVEKLYAIGHESGHLKFQLPQKVENKDSKENRINECMADGFSRKWLGSKGFNASNHPLRVHLDRVQNPPPYADRVLEEAIKSLYAKAPKLHTHPENENRGAALVDPIFDKFKRLQDVRYDEHCHIISSPPTVRMAIRDKIITK
jgi:hypothetical protein